MPRGAPSPLVRWQVGLTGCYSPRHRRRDGEAGDGSTARALGAVSERSGERKITAQARELAAQTWGIAAWDLNSMRGQAGLLVGVGAEPDWGAWPMGGVWRLHPGRQLLTRRFFTARGSLGGLASCLGSKAELPGQKPSWKGRHRGGVRALMVAERPTVVAGGEEKAGERLELELEGLKGLKELS